MSAGAARTRLGVDERREQLVKIGLELFSDRPYEEIWIDEIAAAAGVSKGLLYHYFPSKRDYYVAVVRASAEEMRGVTEPDPALPPLGRAYAGVDAYLDYVEHHAAGFVTLQRGGIAADEEVRAIVDESRSLVAERILSGIHDGPPPEELRIAVRGWIGFVEFASLDWVERRAIARDSLRDLLVKTLVGAIAAAGVAVPELGLP